MVGIHINFLQHIGRVDSSPQPVIQPKLNHLFQTHAVAIEFGSKRVAIAGMQSLKQIVAEGLVSHEHGMKVG
ncbi:MAG: hypothetical protein Fues2KO_16670 [Fuerstiella sp.]